MPLGRRGELATRLRRPQGVVLREFGHEGREVDLFPHQTEVLHGAVLLLSF
jgi:hypothetical protein